MDPIDIQANDERLRDLQREADNARIARNIPRRSLAQIARQRIGRSLITVGQQLVIEE